MDRVLIYLLTYLLVHLCSLDVSASIILTPEGLGKDEGLAKTSLKM